MKERRLLKKTAYLLGVKAADEGKKLIPAFDENMMELLKGLKVGESSELLDLYYKGYIESEIYLKKI